MTADPSEPLGAPEREHFAVLKASGKPTTRAAAEAGVPLSTAKRWLSGADGVGEQVVGRIEWLRDANDEQYVPSAQQIISDLYRLCFAARDRGQFKAAIDGLIRLHAIRERAEAKGAIDATASNGHDEDLEALADELRMGAA